mgnify:FL=1
MNNPYHWLMPNPDIFYGKDRLKMIDEVIAGIGHGESFAIVGGRRMGKTTFLRRLEREIAATTRGEFLPIYLDAQTMPDNLSVDGIFNWIKEHVSYVLSIDFSKKDKILGEWIIRVIKKLNCLRLILIIDEFDQFSYHKYRHIFFSNLRALIHNTPGISEKFSVVVAGARMLQNLYDSPGSPLANVLTWKYLSLLDREDTEKLVREPTKDRFSHEIGEIVWRYTGGHPFIIQYLMHHLCVWSEEGIDERDALERAKNKFIEEHDVMFKGLWFDYLNEGERRIYRILRERGAMTVEEITQEFGYKSGEVRGCLRVLSYVGFVKRAENTQNSYTIAGEILDEWIKENDKKEYIQKLSESLSLHELFDELESAIRHFVIRILKEHGRLVDIQKIFPDEIREANDRYKKESGSDKDCPQEEILLYSDFAFPFKIILKFWKAFYEKFSENPRNRILGRDLNRAKMRFEERMEVLTRIRNALRHGRMNKLSQEEIDKGRIFAQEIISLVRTNDSNNRSVR